MSELFLVVNGGWQWQSVHGDFWNKIICGRETLGKLWAHQGPDSKMVLCWFFHFVMWGDPAVWQPEALSNITHFPVCSWWSVLWTRQPRMWHFSLSMLCTGIGFRELLPYCWKNQLCVHWVQNTDVLLDRCSDMWGMSGSTWHDDWAEAVTYGPVFGKDS